MGHPVVSLMETQQSETTTWPEFPNGEKAIVEQILGSEERNKSKRADWVYVLVMKKRPVWLNG